MTQVIYHKDKGCHAPYRTGDSYAHWSH